MSPTAAPTLLDLQAASRDTVVMVIQRSGLETAQIVATIVIAAAVLAVLFLLVVFMARANRFMTRVNVVAKDVSKRVDPILERGRGTAQNVEFISSVVRRDVEKLNESVSQLRDRLIQASDHMEARIEQFNALMEAVQSEAEEIFVDTASTLRGVRAGAKRLAAPSLDDAGPSDPGGAAPETGESPASARDDGPTRGPDTLPQGVGPGPGRG